MFSELPQLRSTTSTKLGCDARGYSRAGIETSTWYCAILAGRRGPELNKMREVTIFPMLIIYKLISLCQKLFSIFIRMSILH